MNEIGAKQIIRAGVIPGEYDSIDVARADGYMQAIEKAKILVEAIQHTIKYPAAEFHYVQNRRIREALEEWEKVK